jgi:hypothetical protein
LTRAIQDDPTFVVPAALLLPRIAFEAVRACIRCVSQCDPEQRADVGQFLYDIWRNCASSVAAAFGVVVIVVLGRRRIAVLYTEEEVS